MVAKKKPAKKEAPSTAPRKAKSVDVPEDGIGHRLREAREALGLTQVGLATRTKIADKKGEGISRTVLIGYEAGTYKPGAREIRILCETLSVTPNWLLYQKETPFETTQASMNFMRAGDEITIAVRLAVAALALKGHERDLIASLILSIAGRALGDTRLSGLLATASLLSDGLRKELELHCPPETDLAKLGMDGLIELMSRELVTNWGNKIRLDEDGNQIGGAWLYPDPKP